MMGGERLGRVPRRTIVTAILRRRPHELLEETARRFPRVAELGGRGALQGYLISDPEIVRSVVVGQAHRLRKGRGLQRARTLLGDGLLTSEGEVWRHQRRLIQPVFHREVVNGYVGRIVDAAEEHMGRWQDGQEIELATHMSALTLDIVGSTLFGDDIGRHATDVRTGLDAVMARSRTLILPGSQLLDRLPLPSVVRARNAIEQLDGVVGAIIERRRRRDPTGVDRERGGGDVLDLLLAAGQESAAMGDRQVRDEVMTLMLAGHETTAMALTWTWWLLSRHPAAAEALLAELAAVVGDRPATAADLPGLATTRATVAESMRLYPPAWLFARQALDTVDIDGHQAPAGSLAVVCTWAQHRDPRWWAGPTSFRPERWLDRDGRFDESAPGQPRDAYIPFGMGQRICIGRELAWIEAILVLATVAPHWRIDVPPGHAPRPDPAITMRPLGGMPATVRRR
jgi:cytochrome P450